MFALVDAMPSRRPGKGLTGSLSIRKLGRAYAVVERRTDVPPLEFGTLRRHQDVVKQLAACVPAILPVRFGTLLDSHALEEAVSERGDEIDEAFDVVRGHVQFTWRLGRKAADERPRKEGGRPGMGTAKEAGASLPQSGAEYLRHAARAASASPPPAWRVVRTALAPLVTAERYQHPTASLPESLYHLVPQEAAIRYSTLAAALRHQRPSLTTTGPWPPFAFAPEIL